MPVHTGKDVKGCFAQWGSTGKKYYYTCGNEDGRNKAKQKAHIQGVAIGENNLNVSKGGKVKTHLVKEKSITENFDGIFSSVIKENVDSDNHIIKNVCLFGTRHSENDRVYQDKAIIRLAELSEGVKCFINHPSKSEVKERDGVRDLRDWSGIFRGARRDGEKIYADLYCRESYWDLVQDIALMQPTNVGNSINARVKVFSDDKGKESVVDVAALKSVDLVASAATTKNLFESAIDGNEEDSIITAQEIEGKVKAMFFYDDKISEGIIQNKISGDKIKSEIREVTWTANELIEKVLYNDKLSTADKKKKVTDIFDDLDKEVKSRLSKINDKEEAIMLNINDVKSNTEIMLALEAEFKKRLDDENLSGKVESQAKTIEESVAKQSELESKIKEFESKVKALESEKKALQVKLDEFQVAEMFAKKESIIRGLIKESGLPEASVTPVFTDTLMSLNPIMEGEEVKESLEDQVKAYIEDRKSVLAAKSSIKNAGDEFIHKTESKDVTEADVDAFVKNIKKR